MNHPFSSLGNPQATAKADYEYEVTSDGIVLIVDLDRGNPSVTNDIAAVLADIAAQEGLPSLAGYPVIYRDSMLLWDEVQLAADGRFKRFYSLNVTSEMEALRKLRAR